MKKKIYIHMNIIKKYTLQYKWLGLKIFIVILLTLSFTTFFPDPQYIRLVNMGSRSAGVSWISQNRTGGCIVAIDSEKIIKSKISCDQGKKNLHLISIENLTPSTNYRLLYMHGTRIKYLPRQRFQTNPELEDMPPFPNPGYGSIIDQHDVPAVGALVIITPQSDEGGYPVAAKANIEGNFAVDYEQITNSSQRVTIEAIGSGLTWNEKSISSKNHTPIPIIRVRSRE